jgi:two-component system nitrate/nitrite response regulator NarL
MARLIIADDHPIILSGLEAVLRGTAYEIIASLRDGSQVMECIARDRPDLLLLDVSMPRLGGVEVLRTLRSRGDTLPVVLLTAALDNADLLESVRLGVDGIVLKEGAHSQLVQCLDTVLNGGRWIEPVLMQRAVAMTMAGSEEEDRLAELNAREKAITGLVAQGMRNRDIASQLGMNEGTVKVYLHRIYRKLGVSNRTELAIHVGRAGAV